MVFGERTRHLGMGCGRHMSTAIMVGNHAAVILHMLHVMGHGSRVIGSGVLNAVDMVGTMQFLMMGMGRVMSWGHVMGQMRTTVRDLRTLMAMGWGTASNVLNAS